MADKFVETEQKQEERRLLVPHDEARRKGAPVGKTKWREIINAGEIETVCIGRRRYAVWSSVVSYVEKLRAEASK